MDRDDVEKIINDVFRCYLLENQEMGPDDELTKYISADEASYFLTDVLWKLKIDIPDEDCLKIITLNSLYDVVMLYVK